jgi:predicted DsbA family dithiol-disulfide isomerase
MAEQFTLEVVSDYVCPWCYLSWPRIDRLCHEYAIALRWTHYPLHPETPPAGITLEELFGDRGFDIPRMKSRLAALLEAEGLPVGDRNMTFNSRRAQELASWAVTQSGGEAIHPALFEAYFVQGVNLYEVEALVRIAASIELPEAEARDVLETGRFRDPVDEDWTRSLELGIRGVPTYLAGTGHVSGAGSYEELELLVQAAGAVRR